MWKNKGSFYIFCVMDSSHAFWRWAGRIGTPKIKNGTIHATSKNKMTMHRHWQPCVAYDISNTINKTKEQMNMVKSPSGFCFLVVEPIWLGVNLSAYYWWALAYIMFACCVKLILTPRPICWVSLNISLCYCCAYITFCPRAGLALVYYNRNVSSTKKLKHPTWKSGPLAWQIFFPL